MTTADYFLFCKAALALLLAAGGLAALYFGHKMFRTKRATVHEGTLVQWGNLKIDVGTAGALIMLTACFWGYLATLAMPQQFSAAPGTVQISIAPEIPVGPEFYLSSASGTLECRRPEPEIIRCEDLRPGQECGSPPEPIEGLGRLQIARIERKDEENGAEVAKNLLLSLRKILSDRGQREWTKRLMDYPAPTDARGVHRVTFNSVAPEVVAPMCAWLKCEGWTYGPCEFVSKDSQ